MVASRGLKPTVAPRATAPSRSKGSRGPRRSVSTVTAKPNVAGAMSTTAGEPAGGVGSEAYSSGEQHERGAGDGSGGQMDLEQQAPCDERKERVSHVRDAGAGHIADLDRVHVGNPAESHEQAAEQRPARRAPLVAAQIDEPGQHDGAEGEAVERHRYRRDASVGQATSEESGKGVSDRGGSDGGGCHCWRRLPLPNDV